MLDIPVMAPDKRLDILFRLLPFVLPKLNPVDPETIIQEEPDGMWRISQLLIDYRKELDQKENEFRLKRLAGKKPLIEIYNEDPRNQSLMK